ncbi:DUF6959 family protein [Streptomyces sp. A475]|uniref:DUF6959 family protein n=1 Tax=Streptomyces sp. A475 TaxID=3131976 RepID=UPI0040409B0A
MVRLPAHRFPGVLVQGGTGDTLGVLRADLAELHRTVRCRRLDAVPGQDRQSSTGEADGIQSRGPWGGASR